MVNVVSAADVLMLAARLREHLGITPAAGQLVEWVVARACEGDTSENGTGHDFAMSAANQWGVPKACAPQALLPGDEPVPGLVPYDEIVPTLPQRRARRLSALFGRWQADDRLWVEVKHHFLAEHHLDGGAWFHDTRGSGGPCDFFAPVADAYVKVFVAPDGAILKAWLIPHAELIRYVREENRRGGAWNYKVAFSPDVQVGLDIVDAVQTALNAPFPEEIISGRREPPSDAS